MKLLVAAACFAAVAFAAPASAGSVVVIGNTTGSPTYNRPVDNGDAAPTVLSAVGTAVRYDVVEFSVSVTGNYDFLSTASFDNYLGLYGLAFDPAHPLTDGLVYNDDFDDFRSSGFAHQLFADRLYLVVVSGFGNRDFGLHRLTINGPGEVNQINSVPEPATWALMIGGFGLVGAAARRRRAAVTGAV